MSALHIHENNFDLVLNSDKPVLIDFFATWCGPCRMVAPLIEEIAAENPQYLVVKIDIDESPALAEQYGVYSIPSLVVMKDGKVVNQSVGAKPKPQILAMLEG